MGKKSLKSAEELLSMSEFNEKGDTTQLLAPDLTNLSQERSYVQVLREIIFPKKCVANAGSLCNSIKVLVSR